MFAKRAVNAVARFAITKPGPITITKRFGGHGPVYTHYLPKEEVEERIMALLAAYPVIPKDKLTNKAHFQKDLGLDSLSMVELVFEMEQEFSVEINDTDAAHIETVDEAIYYFANTPFTL